MGSDPIYFRKWGQTPFLVLLVLAGCGKPADQVTGFPEPPESFGKVATATFGCPDVTGVYAWPFVEGQAQGFEKNGRERAHAYPEFFGLTLPDRGEIEILKLANRKGQGLHFVVRQIADAPRRGGPGVRRTRDNHQRFLDSRIKCQGGWLVVEEYGHPEMRAPEEYGSTTRVGAKLAPLANGDLAIGQWLRVTDLSGSLFQWGDSRAGTVKHPDRVQWYWSRYERSKSGAGPLPQ
jgi:hypothetical protein